MLNRFFKLTLAGLLVSVLGACATATIEPKDYTAFRAADPHSILVVPVINHSQEAEAADLFLTTLTMPLAERGYYVFPVNMVKDMMEDDGLADAMMVHSADTVVLAELFGADTVLYVEIVKWDASYKVFSADIVVEFIYTLKDGRDGQVLWQEQQAFVYSRGGSGGIGDLIANAVTSMMDNARSDYTPTARAANAAALLPAGQGLPLGPYAPEYGGDVEGFPSNGTGRITNATMPAVSSGEIAIPEPAEDQAEGDDDGAEEAEETATE